jgi:hypothetical protein
MFTLALVFSVLLVAFAAFTAFGLPYMVIGRRAFEDFEERKDQQAMLAVLVAVASLVAALPFAAPALISEAPQVQLIAQINPGASAGA